MKDTKPFILLSLILFLVIGSVTAYRYFESQSPTRGNYQLRTFVYDLMGEDPLVSSTDGNLFFIRGNSVHYENAYGLMNVTPHTISGFSGCYNIEVMPKIATQNYDCYAKTTSGLFTNNKLYFYTNFNSTNYTYTSTMQNRTFNYTCASSNFDYVTTPNKTAWCKDDNANASFGKQIFYHWFESANLATRTIFWQEPVMVIQSSSAQINQNGWLDITSSANKNNRNYTDEIFYDIYSITSKRLVKDTGYNLKWCFEKNKLDRTLISKNEKIDFFCKRSVDTFEEATQRGQYLIIDPWFNTSFNYVQNYSYLNQNGSSLDLIPVCETYNTSSWLALPYNDSIRFTDEAGIEIPSEVFNITQNDLGRVREFTACFVANFTPNQNRTLGIYYDTVIKGKTNYAPLTISNTSTDIAITNVGFNSFNLLKALGGLNSIKDWTGQEYKRAATNGHVLVNQMNNLILNEGEAGFVNGMCRIAENGTIRIKIECQNNTARSGIFSFQNFTFYKNSYFIDAEIGHNQGNTPVWNTYSQVGFDLGELGYNLTTDADLDASGDQFPMGSGLQNEIFQLSKDSVNISYLTMWEDIPNTGYRIYFNPDYCICFNGVDSGQNPIISGTIKKITYTLGFIPTTSTPNSNSTTWKDGAPYFYWKHTPIKVGKQASLSLSSLPPTQGRPIINTTDGLNTTIENITAFTQDVVDDFTPIEDLNIVYDWRKDNFSILLLNLPLDNQITSGTPYLIRDYSQSPRNFTLGGGVVSRIPTWNLDCVKGGCYSFNASQNIYRSLELNDKLNTSVNFTIEIWYKTFNPAFATNRGSLISHGRVGQSNIAYHLSFVGSVAGSSQMRLGATCAGINREFDYVGEKIYAVKDGSWTQIVVVYNGSWFNIYQNGTFLNSTFCANLSTNSQPIAIGGLSDNATDRFWNGSIDEVRIYNMPLTGQQIKSLYNKSIPATNRIHNSTLKYNDSWSVCTTINDDAQDSITNCSIALTIGEHNHIHDTILNSSDAGNTTNGTLNRFYFFHSIEGRTELLNETRWFKNGIEQTVLRNNSQITPENTTKNDIWYFQIRAFHNGAGSPTDFGTSNNLTIENTPPLKPTQVSPLNQSTFYDYSVELNCTDGFDEDNDTLFVEFYVNKTNSAMFLNQNTTENFFNLNRVDNATYQWVCRHNDNTSLSSFTNNLTFIMDTSRIKTLAETNPSPVLEFTSQTFSLNLTLSNISIKSVQNAIYYNGVIRASTTRNGSVYGNNFSHYSTSSFVIPNSEMASNVSYYWNVSLLLHNGTIERQQFLFSHVVDVLNFSSCGASDPNAILNFTLRHEVNDSQLKGDFKGSFTIYGASKDINQTITITNTLINSTTTYICLNTTGSPQLNTDALIEYSGHEGLGYDVRNYYLINHSFLNKANISLYLLDISLATGIEFTVQNPETVPLQGKYILVNRYDAGTNTYKTVSMGRTDQAGKDFMFLRQQDAQHIIIVQDYLDIEFISKLLKFNGATFVITIAEDTIGSIEKLFEGVSTSISFSNSTNNFTFAFTSPSEIVTTCMRVTKISLLDNRLLFEKCVTGTAGSIEYGIGRENGTFVAGYYFKTSKTWHGDFAGQVIFIREAREVLSNALKKDSLVFGFIIAMTIAFSGLWSPSAVIVFTIMGLIGLWMTGFLYGINAYSLFIFIGIIGGFILASMKK